MASTLGKILTFNHGGLVVHLHTEDEVRHAIRAGTLSASTRVRIHGDDGEEASGRASAIALLAPYLAEEDVEPQSPLNPGVVSLLDPTPLESPPRVGRKKTATAVRHVSPSLDHSRLQTLIATKADVGAPLSSPVEPSKLASPKQGSAANGWGCALIILGMVMAGAGATNIGPWSIGLGVLVIIIAAMAKSGQSGNR